MGMSDPPLLSGRPVGIRVFGLDLRAGAVRLRSFGVRQGLGLAVWLIGVLAVNAAWAQTVFVPTGDGRLAATLHLPERGEAPFPAVVLVHDSLPSDRRYMQGFVELALESGLAALAYDKRGTGQSDGRFRPVTLRTSEERLARLGEDASVMADWLRRQPQVDPDRIGLMGASQAGWVMPIAASGNPMIRFLIAIAGTPLSVGEQAYYFGLVRGWYGEALSRQAADARVSAYDGLEGFNPTVTLRNTSQPMLWIFGEVDDVVPARASIAALLHLREAGFDNHDYIILPDTDHDLFDRRRSRDVSLVPVVRDWLEEKSIILRKARN